MNLWSQINSEIKIKLVRLLTIKSNVSIQFKTKLIRYVN